MVHLRENKQILEEEKSPIVGQRKESDKNYFFALMYREKFLKKKNFVPKRKKNSTICSKH